MITRKQTTQLWILVFPVIVLLYFDLWLTIRIRYPVGISAADLRIHYLHFSIIFFLWIVVMFTHNIFDLASFKRYTTLVRNILVAMSVNFLIAVVYFYVQPTLILTPRRFLLIDVALSALTILAWNLLLKQLLSRQATENIYLFSQEHELDELEREIRNHAFLGLRIGGHLQTAELAQLDVSQVTSVILSDNLSADPRVIGQFFGLRQKGVLFYNHRDFYESLTRRVYLSRLSELWFLENIHYKEGRVYNVLKRVIDLAAGVVGFLIFVATFPIIAFMIKLGTSGPIFFTQPRVGRKGRPFRIYKYKTMSGGPTDTWTAPNDPRITGVGRFLRKTRLDELPQVINLLRGEVSLVGPRPEQVGIAEQLRQAIPFYDERHIVKPGITGWAQLHTYAASVEETKLKLQYDLYYVKHRSILFDLEIIAKTLYYVFTWSGK